MINGIIVIDKPENFTSFDVVAVMRKLTNQKKIGHTGTLDPMATGVLPIMLGNATKALSILPDSSKEYVAEFKLGITTNTEDITGKIICQKEDFEITEEEIKESLEKFKGEIKQIPPMYSAVKKNGKRLYELAREGIEIDRDPRIINIKALNFLNYNQKEKLISIKVECSKGTYIRTLCSDIGKDLRCGAVLTKLRRTKACGFSLDDSITLDEAKILSKENKLETKVFKTNYVFNCYEKLKISEAQALRFSNGGYLSIERLKANEIHDKKIFRVFSPKEEFLGLGIINLDSKELLILKNFSL